MGAKEFMKNFKESKGRVELRHEINELESALLDTYNNLQLVNDEGLLDFYAYLIKAYEAKHKYLLKSIKDYY